MRDLALALFVLTLIPFIVMRPYVGLLTWAWFGYMNPHRLTYGFAYSFPWVMIIAILTLASLVLSRESKRIPKSTFSVLLFVFLGWAAITTYFAAEQAAAWAKFLEFAKILIMVFVTLMVVNDRRRMHGLMWVIVASLGFFGVKGGLFTIAHGGSYHVWGPSGSFIADNNALALALCMILPLMRYLQLHSTEKTVRIALGLSMALTGVAILGTYSRGGLIGLAIVGAALIVKSRRRVALLLALMVISVTALNFMPAKWTARMDTLHQARSVNSAQTRIESWKFATNVAIHRPATGGGFEVYQSTSLWDAYAPKGAKQRAIHSIFFRVLGEQGFAGLVLFLALLAVSWRNCARIRKRAKYLPEQKWAFDLASMLQVSLLAYIVTGAFLPMPYFDLTYQLMAVCAILGRYIMKGTEESTPRLYQHIGAKTSARSSRIRHAVPRSR